MENFNSSIYNIVKECLEKHYEQISTNSFLFSQLCGLHYILNELVLESEYGIKCLEKFTSSFDIFHNDDITQFNKHGEIIADLINKGYDILNNMKPILWSYNAKIFDQLSLVLHQKALWTYKAYANTYHREMHLVPGNTYNTSEFMIRFIKGLLHVDLNESGQVVLGKPLVDIIEDMRKENNSSGYFQKYPMTLGMRDVPKARIGNKDKIEDWMFILDVTRNKLPINLSDSSISTNFINERKAVVRDLVSANEKLHSFIHSSSNLESIERTKEKLANSTTKLIIAKIRSQTHFHLDIKWGNFSEVSLQVTGPIAVESGVTISTSKILDLLTRYPNSSIQKNMKEFGIKLFDAIFVGSSWQDKGSFGEEEKYKGIYLSYNKGRQHSEQKTLESTFTVNTRMASRFDENNIIGNIPFEILHDGDDFLSLKYSFYRYPLDISNAPPFYISGVFNNALLIASNPMNDIPEVVDEVKDIQNVLISEGCDCDIIDHDFATLENIITALENKQYDLIHFAGHSFFDQNEPETSYILLGTKETGLQKFNAISLRKYMRICKAQLVFFNSCNSSNYKSIGDSYGLADCIVRGGIPSVIGMQWPISSRIAVEISAYFYRFLLRGNSAESALMKTRKFIGSKHGWQNSSWACPVLVQAPQ